MADYTKEVITKQVGNADSISTTQQLPKATTYQTTEYLVYFFFGFLEVLLGLRFLLKIAGASYTSDFVNFIYRLTGAFIMPFDGIFRSNVSEGLESSSVMEPATIVAIIVYALIAFGIVQLIRVASGKQQSE